MITQVSLSELPANIFKNFRREKKSTIYLAKCSLLKEISTTFLNEKELERQEKFYLIEDKERFLLAHSLKKIILARYTKQSPYTLEFDASEFQKPYLKNSFLNFNLSHSGSWVALAVSTLPIGIDVEFPDHHSTILPEELVYHHRDKLASNIKSKIERFYTTWTLKEAIAKCDGRGLGLPFTNLRLDTYTDHNYLGFEDLSRWYAHHWKLYDGAHLSVASTDRFYPQLFEITSF